MDWVRPEDRVGTVINEDVKIICLIRQPYGGTNKSVWLVEAECQHCGRHFEAMLHNLLAGRTTSCGCLGRGPKKGTKGEPSKLSIGKLFGEIKVLDIVGWTRSGSARVLAECQHCKDKTQFVTLLKHVKSGNTKSCGCIRREVRTKECEERCGPNSPVWMGGLSFAPYCEKWTHKLRERIRDEYGRRCFLCGKTEEANGKRLSVHHTDYDKEQGCSGKGLALVPLCNSCHSKTNSRREHWKDLFNMALKAIYEVPEDAQ